MFSNLTLNLDFLISIVIFQFNKKMPKNKQQKNTKKRKGKMCTVQCLIQVFQTGREYFLGEYVELCFADGISVKLSVGKEKKEREKGFSSFV